MAQMNFQSHTESSSVVELAKQVVVVSTDPKCQSCPEQRQCLGLLRGLLLLALMEELAGEAGVEVEVFEHDPRLEEVLPFPPLHRGN